MKGDGFVELETHKYDLIKLLFSTEDFDSILLLQAGNQSSLNVQSNFLNFYLVLTDQSKFILHYLNSIFILSN